MPECKICERGDSEYTAAVGPTMSLRGVHLINQARHEIADETCNAAHRAPQSFGRVSNRIGLVTNPRNSRKMGCRRCLGRAELVLTNAAHTRSLSESHDGDPLRVGIDASNLRGGGGITHLAALLSHLEIADAGVEQIVVWGSRAVLGRLVERPWLVKFNPRKLEGSAAARLAWRQRTLPRCARDECDLLFAPGGLCTDRFHPVVTMSRNMLPFQFREMARYGLSRMFLRLGLLRSAQRRSFQIADGVMLLSFCNSPRGDCPADHRSVVWALDCNPAWD